jgi:pimeloyl-ACP methyl ester carboxylesterase
LIVHGRQDAFVPVAYVDDFLGLLPNATAQIIDHAGHMLVAEAPREVHAAIETFLGATIAPANLAGAQR